MSDTDYALQPLLSHLYGPALGRIVAQLTDARKVSGSWSWHHLS